MAPNGYIMAELGHEEPVSRTYQYRKVMKPMLERKRRARINRCLDELKELMVGALQSDGENVSKLEKADILELTVRHLHGLKRSNQLVAKPEMTYADRFRSGFTQCAAEVSQFLSTAVTPEGVRVDRQSGVKLMQHLGGCIRRLDVPVQQSQTQQLYHVEHTPVPSKQLVQPKQHFVTVPNAMYTPPSSPGHHTGIGGDTATMWRPW